MTDFDFATGNTNPEDFPVAALQAAASRAIAGHVDALNRYPGGLGHPGLRALMAERESTREGVPVDPDQLFLTNGSMQGVTLCAQTLCRDPNAVIVLEENCYVGSIAAFRSLRIDMVGVPVHHDGMDLDVLENTLEELVAAGRPVGFIYTLATYQNPTGAVMSRAARLRLIEIAKRFDALVVEDNCYGDVHFDGEQPPALFALDDDPRHIYLGSLSKIFAPGMRLGYVYAKEPHLQRMINRRNDAGSNTFAAATMCEYFRDGQLWPHIERANIALKAKRDAMLDALQTHLGNVCSWSHPAGGLFIWIRLPEDVDMDRLRALGVERDVTFASGSAFHIRGEDVRYIRLAFGYPRREAIAKGIAVLAACINDARTGS